MIILVGQNCKILDQSSIFAISVICDVHLKEKENNRSKKNIS